MANQVIPTELRLGLLLGAPPDQVRPYGLAPRGLYQDGGGVPYNFQVLDRVQVWADGVERLYEQANSGSGMRATTSPGNRGAASLSRWSGRCARC